MLQVLEIPRRLPAFKLRGWLMEQFFYCSYPVYGCLFKQKRQAWPWTTQQLGHFAQGSLGKEIFHFLDKNGFEMLAKFESHDALHVLLEYSTHIVDEVRMQFCLLGNGTRTPYLFMVIIIGWLAFPECWHLFTDAFKRGKKLAPIHRWQFEYLLREPVFLLRNCMSGFPSENVPLFI